ncbi:MAG: hypothetical protein K8F91_25345 [Candidatus Obscuribacterales bacterium]|nr:hypothetical protein [Candidatus Obscuribacterales bacterium]
MQPSGGFDKVSHIVDCVQDGKDANSLLDGLTNKETRDLMKVIGDGRRGDSISHQSRL